MKIELPDYCCPYTATVTKEGDRKCDHIWKKLERDEDVRFECTLCGRVVWYEVYQ